MLHPAFCSVLGQGGMLRRNIWIFWSVWWSSYPRELFGNTMSWIYLVLLRESPRRGRMLDIIQYATTSKSIQHMTFAASRGLLDFWEWPCSFMWQMSAHFSWVSVCKFWTLDMYICFATPCWCKLCSSRFCKVDRWSLHHGCTAVFVIQCCVCLCPQEVCWPTRRRFNPLQSQTCKSHLAIIRGLAMVHGTWPWVNLYKKGLIYFFRHVVINKSEKFMIHQVLQGRSTGNSWELKAGILRSAFCRDETVCAWC